MKKILPVVLAVITGCTCAFILFKKVEKETILETPENAVAIQIGVFTKKENAIAMSENYGGLVLEDEGVYRVYYSVLSKSDNIDFITNYLKNNGINYYIKKITLSDETLDKLSEYEELMEKTKDTAKITVNKELLKIYEEVI